MSIEDVDYLLEHSVENSIVIFVDSKNRDMQAYPTPSSYVVDFSDHPIKNVYGMEILDATIPATAYTIDEYTCGIGFTQIFNTPGVPLYDTTNSTSFATNIALLQLSNGFNDLFTARASANLFICTNRTNYLTIKAENTNIINTNNAVFYVGQVPIVFDGLYTVTVDNTTFMINDEYVYNKWVESTDILTRESDMSFNYISSSQTLVYIEFMYVLDNVATNYVSMFKTIATFNTDNDPFYDFYLCNTYLSIINGSYTSEFLMSTLQSMFNGDTSATPPVYYNSFPYHISSNDPTTVFAPNIRVAFSDHPTNGTSSITQVVTFTSSCEYQFFFDMEKTTANFILGFSEYANSAASKHTSSDMKELLSLAFTTPLEYTTFSYRDNLRMFMSLTETNSIYPRIISPGVINLESVRYLILRCPEIESHMLGSYANFKYAPGIGLFKLTSSNSLMNLRFDFVNITRKPFHPIGKLAKLSLTFEQKNGELYDFKGVDHVLLLSIKYYSPKNITRVPRSILNPYYNPNILEYQLQQYNSNKSTNQKQKQKPFDIEDVIREQKQYMK